METELIIAAAQLLTGIATFTVATFLAAQLMMQKKQLEIAHGDSNRNLAFASRTRTQELTIAQIINEPMVIGYENARTGIEEISDADTRGLFGMQREFYVQLLTEWALGSSGHVDHLNIEYYKGRVGIIMPTVGERQYYVSNSRIILSLLETSGELAKLGGVVYQELEGRSVPLPS